MHKIVNTIKYILKLLNYVPNSLVPCPTLLHGSRLTLTKIYLMESGDCVIHYTYEKLPVNSRDAQLWYA